MDVYVLTLSPLSAAVGSAAQTIFPSLALGLGCYLAVLEILWIASRNEDFRTLYGFWASIFGVCLALGCTALLVQGRALGWAWTAPQLATAIAALAALAAALLFGQRRAGAPSHVLASLVMAAALLAATAWVAALERRINPAGGAAPELFARYLLGACLVTSLAVGAASAGRLLRRPEESASATALRMAVGMLAISAILRLAVSEPAAQAQPSAVEAWPLQLEAGLGAAVLSLALWAGWLVRRRGGPERSRPFLRACLAMGAVGLAAVLAGWMVGRSGRAGASAGSALAATSLEAILLWAAYALLFGAGGYLVVRLAARPLDDAEPR